MYRTLFLVVAVGKGLWLFPLPTAVSNYSILLPPTWLHASGNSVAQRTTANALGEGPCKSLAGAAIPDRLTRRLLKHTAWTIWRTTRTRLPPTPMISWHGAQGSWLTRWATKEWADMKPTHGSQWTVSEALMKPSTARWSALQVTRRHLQRVANANGWRTKSTTSRKRALRPDRDAASSSWTAPLLQCQYR